ncbi:hypothetical protein OAN96_00910 [Candidatus Gracilibacteria bacterium]|nr:hypothetical protein [Candidatus Gracilibacteria bacterium]
MDIEKKIGPESYKKGNFFYELIENHIFSINSYNELIENIKIFQEKDPGSKINKKTVKHLYVFMSLYAWSINDYKEGKYNIVGIKNEEHFFDYYETLDMKIIQLLS